MRGPGACVPVLKQSYSHEGHVKWPSAHAELRAGTHAPGPVATPYSLGAGSSSSVTVVVAAPSSFSAHLNEIGSPGA